MYKKFLKRFRSPVVITSFLTLILFFLKNYNLLSFLGLDENSYQELTNIIVGLLIAFGILNNPEDRKGF